MCDVSAVFYWLSASSFRKNEGKLSSGCTYLSVHGCRLVIHSEHRAERKKNVYFLSYQSWVPGYKLSYWSLLWVLHSIAYKKPQSCAGAAGNFKGTEPVQSCVSGVWDVSPLGLSLPLLCASRESCLSPMTEKKPFYHFADPAGIRASPAAFPPWRQQNTLQW